MKSSPTRGSSGTGSTEKRQRKEPWISRRAHRSRAVWAVLLGLLVIGLGASGRAMGASDVGSEGERALARVAEPFQSLKTFYAEFTQSQLWIGMDEPTIFRGSLYISRPNRFRMEYSEPHGHLQVSDGTQVWTYVPENEQVLLTKLGEGQGGDILGRILTESEADPEVETVDFDGERAEILVLDPPLGLELRQVRLWTRGGSSEILQYELTESSGNRTTYRLLETRENPELDEALFHFEAPPGVPVVELGSP